MKYELDQTIFYMLNSRVHSAPVLARKRVDNLHPNWTSTPKQADVFTPFGLSGVFYGTCHGIITEANAFPTKEALLASL